MASARQSMLTRLGTANAGAEMTMAPRRSIAALCKSGNGIFTGMGHHTRANAETCLLCSRKGKKLPHAASHSIKQAVMSPAGEHSEKPDDVADRTADLFGSMPRIELLARHRRRGWHPWGNEVSDDVQLLIKGA